MNLIEQQLNQIKMSLEQVEVCKESFLKDCLIEYRKEAKRYNVTVCNDVRQDECVDTDEPECITKQETGWSINIAWSNEAKDSSFFIDP